MGKVKTEVYDSQRRSQEKIEGSEYKLKSTDHFYYGLYFYNFAILNQNINYATKYYKQFLFAL